MAFISNSYLENASKYCEVREFVCAEILTAGDWVDLDVSQSDESRSLTVVQGNGTELCVGVALEDKAAASGSVKVAVGGYVEGAKAGNITANAGLMPDVAGSVLGYAAASLLSIVGVALEDDALSGFCDVYVWRKY